MILGIGVDICSVLGIERIYKKHGNRFIEKLGLEEASISINKLSKHWAAMEALSKATTLGLAKSGLKSIKIINKNNGAPELVLCEKLKEKIKEKYNVEEFRTHISLSDDGIYVIAMVILEKK